MTTKTVNGIRTIILAGISSGIPEAGGVVSAIVGVLWPASQEDVWALLKDKVEALIDKKVSEEVYGRVETSLRGLKNSLGLYLDRLKDSQEKPLNIYEQCVVTLDDFALMYPAFQQKNHEVLLLPLYAQMMNLYLAVLSDLVIEGEKWGATSQEISTRKRSLSSLIDESVAYCKKWIKKGREQKGLKDLKQITVSEDWDNLNHYLREMQLAVSDYSFFWPYFDREKGPPPCQTREIQSDLVARNKHTEQNDPFIPPPDTIFGALSRIKTYARADGWIFGIELTYGNKVIMLGLRQDPSAGYALLPVTMDVRIYRTNRVLAVNVSARPGSISYLGLTFKDGTVAQSGVMSPYDYDNYHFSYHNQVLASIRMVEARNIGIPGKIIFGFRFPDSYR